MASIAYRAQKSAAKKRGIEWQLSYEQWFEWWGDDLARRGCGRNQLMMCRVNDRGPYALGNIFKGTPKQNQASTGAARRNAASRRRAQVHQASLDALMHAPSKEPGDEIYSEDQRELLDATGALVGGRKLCHFVGDKHR